MAKTKKKLTLPKSKNGHRRKSLGFALWGYEKERVRKEAREKNCSMSYLVNMRMFKDWL